MDPQLAKLNGEVDVIFAMIVAKDAELKSAAEADKDDIRKSLADLRGGYAARSASRDSLALALATAISPGKSGPIAFQLVPLLYMRAGNTHTLFVQVIFFFCQLFPNSSHTRVFILATIAGM